ncbi:uncharacterized protein TNCV_2458091 [Trichonephila clavipes]|nr:uncharacterized protein TNCV_2458091 [Trichonephila clavipes]
MTSCNYMCCLSCNGSQEPFFNKTMPGLTRQGCHKAVSALLVPLLGLADPQICLQLSISGNHFGWRVGHPTSLNELETWLQQIWNEMSQNIKHNLYASIPDRIASRICAKGGSTGC